MKNIFKAFGIIIIVLAAVVGFSCSSSPYILANEPPKPDARSAVVIFVSDKSSKATVWDGEKPIGTYEGTPTAAVNCIFWKTTVGAHTFVANSFNKVHKRISLQANKTYYFRIYTIPAAYITPIVMDDMTKEDFDKYIKIRTTKYMEFDDEWRKATLAKNDGKELKEIREYLKTAK